MSRRKKQGRRIEAAADSLADSAPDKVGPLIHSAADVVGSAADRVGPLAQAAADRVAPLAQAAADRVQPYAQSAYESVSGRVAEKVSPLASQAAGLIEPYAQQAAGVVGPYAKEARKRGAHLAHDALERLTPALDDALDRVTPVIEQTRDRVQGEWLPKLADRLSDVAETAASSPAAVEAQRRSRAAAAALRGELILPEDEPRKKSRWALRLVVITAVGGAIFYLLRRFLAGGESDWQAARPTPYTSTTITEPTGAQGSGSSNGTGSTNGTGPSSPETAPNTADAPNPASVVASHDVVFEVAPDADAVSSPKPAHAADEPGEASTPDEAPAEAPDEELVEGGDSPDRAGYGNHAYIGAIPPQGFLIKANERSKKYHLPDMAGYQRTNTEVWFDSEEAAEAAGFTKAQR